MRLRIRLKGEAHLHSELFGDSIMAEDEARDIDIVIRQVQQQIPQVKIGQWHKILPGDDDNLWWFSLPGSRQDVEIEGASIQIEGASCPFLIETDGQDCKAALKASTIEEATAMIVTYLKSVGEGSPCRLTGEFWWTQTQ